MRVGLVASMALVAASCGSRQIDRAVADDPESPGPAALPGAGGRSAGAGEAGETGDPTAAPTMCSGAGFEDPSAVVLHAREGATWVGVRADGRRVPLPPVPPPPGVPGLDDHQRIGPAEVPGWEIVRPGAEIAHGSAVFHEIATHRLQELRHRPARLADLVAGSRIVYLAPTGEGMALVDEGVLDARATLLPADLPSPMLREGRTRLIVGVGGVPVASYDPATGTVAIFERIAELVVRGARRVGYGFQVLIDDLRPVRAVDAESFAEIDLTRFALPATNAYEVRETDASVLLTADGAPALHVDRRTLVATVLDPAKVRAGALEGETETHYSGSRALVVVDGVPRSFIELETGRIESLTLALAGSARSHWAGEAVVVTAEGVPRFVLHGETARVVALPDVGVRAYDTVTVRVPWVVGFDGEVPVFRVHIDADTVERLDAPLPLPYSFYDARFASDPSNHPPAAQSLLRWTVDEAGSVMQVLRDDAQARAFRLDPEAGWAPVGEPFRDVRWAKAEARAHAFVIESGVDVSCYCALSEVSWSGARAQGVLTEAVQIVPRGDAPPVTIEGTARVQFHGGESCVAVVPEGNGGEPFVYDILTGRRTQLEGFDGVAWAAR